MATLSQAINKFPTTSAFIMLSHNTSVGVLFKENLNCSMCLVTYIPCMVTHALSFVKDLLLTVVYAVGTLVLGLLWSMSCCRSEALGFFTKKCALIFLSSLEATGIDLLGIFIPCVGHVRSERAVEKYVQWNNQINKHYKNYLNPSVEILPSELAFKVLDEPQLEQSNT